MGILNKTELKKYVRKKGLRTRSNTYEYLEKELERQTDRAIVRALSNKRKSVSSRDF